MFNRRSWNSRVLGAMVLLVILGSFLRAWQYWQFPVAGETQDEVAWTLLGASLIQERLPVSWSFFSGYETYAQLESGGAEFRLVSPALDHPPLFSLLPGLAQTLTGKDWLGIPSIKVIRFPMIILGIFNLSLMAAWLYRVSVKQLGTSGKLTALAIFATAPSFVFLSRLVVSENLILTWVLMLLLLGTFTSTLGWRLQLLTLIALPLTKISGIAVAAAEVFVEVVQKRRWLPTALALGGGILALGFYAAMFDLPLFLQVQFQQAQRDTGLLTLFSSQIWLPSLVQKNFADVWITMGYIAGFAWLLLRSKSEAQEKQLAYLSLAQLAFIVLSVGENTVHGWYRIGLLPFFAYSMGWLAESVWRNRSWLGLSIGWLLAMPVIRLGWLAVDTMSLFRNQAWAAKLTLAFAGGSVLGEVVPSSWRERWWKISVLLLVIAVLSGNILTVLFLKDQSFWQDELYLEQGIRP